MNMEAEAWTPHNISTHVEVTKSCEQRYNLQVSDGHFEF